jgi:hypothetical protein
MPGLAPFATGISQGSSILALRPVISIPPTGEIFSKSYRESRHEVEAWKETNIQTNVQAL